MKRIVSLLICLVAFATISESQVSRNRIKTTPSYGWPNRVVPTAPFQDSTWKSFHNIIDDGKAQVALAPTAVKTVSYLAVVNDFVPINCASGSFTLQLPTTPTDGVSIGCKMILTSGTNSVLIKTGGSDVFNKAGGSATLQIVLLNQGMTFQYKATTGIWYVMNDNMPLSQLDSRFYKYGGNNVGSGSYTNAIGTTSTNPMYFRPNIGTVDSIYMKYDQYGQLVIQADSNQYNPAISIRSGYNNNSYMQLDAINIAAYRLKNRLTGYEWYLQNQTFGGGLGIDAFAIGVTSNPSASFFQLSKRGESKTECYYNNTLIIGMQMDSAGHFSTGSTLPGAASFRMSQIHRGGATATGIFLQGTIANDVTTSFRGIFIQPTYSASASRGSYIGSTMGTPSLGSNTLTSLTYYDTGTELAAATVTGDTYGYFCRPNVVATRNVWGFFANGTAPNFFKGPLSIGSSTTTAAAGSYSADINGGLNVRGIITGSNSILSSHQTAGIGYATSSGSTVTQGTNRTTGVTINAINGAITLVSAAGLATYQTFQVTNSSVAATDVIILSQKSGTDLYLYSITNVAAGSFKMSFATTGGVTVEQPVFNFAVIKAVAN